MQKIDVHAHSTAGADRLYALLLDGSTWPVWSPLGAYREEPGGIRVFTTGRHTTREEVVERIPDRKLAYRLLSGMAIRGYRADVDLTPTPDGGTDIRWHSTFTAQVPGTGWLYRRILGRFIQQCADGLAAAGAATRPNGADQAGPRPDQVQA